MNEKSNRASWMLQPMCRTTARDETLVWLVPEYITYGTVAVEVYQWYSKKYERINGAVTATVHVHACMQICNAAPGHVWDCQEVGPEGTSHVVRSHFLFLLVITRDTREKFVPERKRSVIMWHFHLFVVIIIQS